MYSPTQNPIIFILDPQPKKIHTTRVKPGKKSKIDQLMSNPKMEVEYIPYEWTPETEILLMGGL